MGLTINPMSLFEFLQKKLTRKQDKICDYLDSIAEEAKSLATIWATVADELATKGVFDCCEKAEIKAELRKRSAPNQGPYAKLQEFYYLFSLATSDKLDTKWQDHFIHRLSMLLYLRRLTLEQYETEVSTIKRATFVDSSNRSNDLADLQRLVTALQNEAGSLEVLAKTIRVAIDA